MKRNEPFDSIEDMLAFNSRDWAKDKGDAWLWGIIHGWPNGAYKEIAARFGLTPEQIDHQKKLHKAWKKAKKRNAE